MNAVRTLPVRPRRIEGEAFGSFVERLARDLNMSLASLLERTGFIADDSFRAIPVGYGIASADPPLEALAQATRQPTAEIQRMLLSHYDGIALDLHDVDPSVPDSFRRIAVREWAYFSSTRVCPACVAENDGALLLRWRLPWSFACTQHELLLADTCSRCGYDTGSGRRDGRTAPAFITRIPKPGFCSNPMPTGFAYAGRSATPCGFPLVELAQTPLARSSAPLAVQRQLDALLDGQTDATVGGGAVATLSYFSDLRSVVALILHTGLAQDLGSLSTTCAEAWAAHEEDRESTLNARAAARARGDGKRGPRMRLYLSAPTKAALLAAVVPTAAEILAAPSSARLTKRLGWIARRAREIDPGLVHRLDKAVKLSAPLQNAWQVAVDSGGSFSSRTGLRHGAGDRFSFGANDVPQLLWPDIYDSEFAELLPQSNRDNARCFCSVALVKIASGATWGGAGVALGLSGHATQTQANNLSRTLTKNARSQEFGDRLLRLAQRIEEQSITRIDYGERRRMFSTFHLIDARRWAELCGASSISVGGKGRRRWASVWMLSELTGNDFRRHPSLQGPNADNLREMYKRFLARELPLLRNALTGHAASLLADSTGSS
jgi:hypothetical protein